MRHHFLITPVPQFAVQGHRPATCPLMFNRFSSTTPNSQPSSGSNPFFGGGASNISQGPPGGGTISPFNAFGGGPAPTLPTSAAPSVPYAITNELENGMSIKLLSISSMPAYRHLSQEEIRVDDYAKGRKGPSSFPGSKPGAFSQPFSSSSAPTNNFGFSSPTAAAVTPSTSTSFSGFGGFGGGAQSAFGSSGNTFGGTANNTFGGGSTTNAGSGGFGSANNAFGSASNAFGGPSSSSLGGPFGSASNMFGSSSSAAAPSTGFGSGAFGAPPTTAPVAQSPFGATTASSGFGGVAPAATSSFGSSGFGSSNAFARPSATSNFASTATPSFSFNNQAQPQPTSGIFGASSSTPSSSGLFGTQQQPQPQQQQSAFGSSGLFGAPKPPQATSGLFGSVAAPSNSGAFAPPQSSTGTFGSFGGPASNMFSSQPQQPQQAQQQQTSNNLFGSQSSGGLFGSSSTASAAPTGAFGSVTGNNSLFGGSSNTSTINTNPTGGFNQQQLQPPSQQQTPSSGLFGSSSLFRPSVSGPTATTPLPTNTSSSLFGSSSLGGGLGGGMTSSSSLFNNRPALTSNTGSATNTNLFSSNNSNNLFSSSSNQALPQQQGINSMNFPSVSASNSCSLAPPLPEMYKSSSSTTTTHSNQVTSNAPRSPVKFTPRTSFRIKPREAYNLTAPIPFGNLNNGSGSSSSNTTATGTTVLVPRKLAGSLNVKKLVIPEFNDNFNHESTEYSTIANTTTSSYNATPSTNSTILTDSMPFGHQFTFPPIKVLASMTPQERSEIKNFVIGQKGIGEIRFLLPVDLSDCDFENFFGHLIDFCDGEAVLYPDPSIPKPEPGKGLNVPAQVRLERIWTLSKGSRDPITDPRSEKVALFTQKLQETEGTHFVSYEPSTGTWIFTVDHF